AAFAQLLANRKARWAFGLGAALLMGLNIWFVLSSALFQGRHLDQAPHFLASFRNLEHVYQTLRSVADRDSRIEVRDDSYTLSSAERADYFLDPYIIRYYIEAREKELWGGQSPGAAKLEVFDLTSTAGGGSGDSSSTLRWKGIQLSRVDQSSRPR